jgi:hypothetical protein
MNTHRTKPLLGVYCLDQDSNRTSSRGIYRFTKKLIVELSRDEQPWRTLLLLSEANAKDFKPESLPPDWTAVVLPGSYGRGMRRLLADHWLGWRLARKHGCDVLWYPKGWISIFNAFSKPLALCTLHDTIPNYYLRNGHGGTREFLSSLYFNSLMHLGLRRAQLITTVSHTSKEALTKLVPEARDRIEVVPEGGRLVSTVTSPQKMDRLVVFGSDKPHKATRETLELLDRFSENSSRTFTVSVIGMTGFPEDWRFAPTHSQVEFLGRVSDEALARTIAESRATVFLSHVEGFGLPFLESYMLGTPVCYRSAHSLAEIADGLPGGYDGSGISSFSTALEAVLAMDENEIETARQGLLCRFTWEKAAAAMSGAIHRALSAVDEQVPE